jgi:CheY-like chemotaxis protein
MTHKVLVVDDAVLLHRLYDAALRSYARCGIEPHFAASGAEALRRLSEHPDTALVMLDVNMPAMTGLECLAQLRREPALREIPVVLQSTEDQTADIQRGLAAGARGYLTKPFTPQQVHRLLDLLLD